jgi:hypothetical protein
MPSDCAGVPRPRFSQEVHEDRSRGQVLQRSEGIVRAVVSACLSRSRREGRNVNHTEINSFGVHIGCGVPQLQPANRNGASTAERNGGRGYALLAVGRGLPVRCHHRRSAADQIVSLIDEHTRECLGGLVERSITVKT